MNRKKIILVTGIFVLLLLMMPELIFRLQYQVFAPTSHYEYATYRNFETYQNDFDKIANLLQDDGKRIYYIDVRNDDKSREISEKTFVGISFHDENENLCQLKISDSDMMSLKNILLNCYGYQYNRIGFDWVCVNEQGVFFNYGEKGCGIARTNNIHKFIQWYGNGFSHLSDDWYGIY